MTFNFNLPNRRVDMGILIGRKSLWGRGYGQEAWGAALDYLLHDSRIDRVTGGCHVENKKMIQIMEAVGMWRVQTSPQKVDPHSNHDPVVRYEYHSPN
jgi:RimJ/RimL family protein N-acetyltransferase